VADNDAPAGQANGRQLNEDWAATVLGLVLIALAMLGVITKAMVP